MQMWEKESLELSVIMPCRNEEHTLAACIREAEGFLRGQNLTGEILVVDNASSDASAEVAAASGARVVTEPAAGYGNALRTGICQSRGRILILGDCDTTYDFSGLEEMYGLLAEKGCDMVIGNRFAGGIEPGAMSLSHKAGVRFLSLLGRKCFHTRVYDFHCGLRGLTRSAAERLVLVTEGMEFATEMIAEAAEAELVIGQIPVRLRRCDSLRKSKLRTIPDGMRHLVYMIKRKNRGARREMQKEIQKRKKRFWVVCLAAVLLLQGVMPSLTAMARDHDMDDTTTYSMSAGTYTGSVKYMAAGEIIKFVKVGGGSEGFSICYKDTDETVLGTDIFTVTESGINSHVILDYRDDTVLTTTTRLVSEPTTPVIWEITKIMRSGGRFESLTLKAVVATEHNIIYNVDSTKGANASGNPSKFYEGVGATIAPATANPGYSFAGWYTTDESTATTSYTIPTTETADVTLTAKFVPNHYNISYDLVGGSNAATNPSDYTYGTGVAGFADPTRDGYTFEGWYDSAAYATQITSISATNTGDVNLWAKWAEIVEDEDDEDDEDDEPEPVATPQPAVKDAVPKTGDTAGAAVPVLLAGGTVTALGLLALGKRRSRRA